MINFQQEFNPQLAQTKGAAGDAARSRNEPNPMVNKFVQNIASKMFGPQAAGTVANMQAAGGPASFMGQKLATSMAGGAAPAAGAAGTGAAAGAPLATFAPGAAAATTGAATAAGTGAATAAGTAGAAGAAGASAGGAGMAASMCFIFAEANNGILPWYVVEFRKCLDTKTRRIGYFRMSRWLVPLMRTSPLLKKLLIAIMTRPMSAFAAWFCGEPGFQKGFWYLPVVWFWVKIWDWTGTSKYKAEHYLKLKRYY